MYSLEDVNKCRDVIIRILRGTQREGIENVLAYMDEYGFYSAAASCKFHNNFYGGLAKHSLEVFWEADELWLKLENNDEKIIQESIKITAFLHDICKIDAYPCELGHNPYFNHKVNIKYHGKKSIDILTSLGLKLNECEREAIRWHMGRFTDACNLNENEATFHYVKIAIDNPLAGIIMAAASNASAQALGKKRRYDTYDDFVRNIQNE